MINFDARELSAAMQNMANDIRDSLSESGLRQVGVAGAAVFRDEAKQNALAHAKTRTILNNIIIKRIEEDSDGGRRQVYLVTVRKGDYGGGDAFYWRFVEFGHKFVPKNKKVSKKTGKKIGWKAHRRAAELEYGTASAPAYPFMRPAYESMKGAAMDAMTKKLAEVLQRNATHDD